MIINGQTGAIEQPPTIKIDPVRGLIKTRIWHCTDEASANATMLQNGTLGVAISKSGGDPIWVVQADYGSDPDSAEVPQDEYTLDSNSVQKDLLDADHDLVNALDTLNKTELRQYMQDPSAYANGTGFSFDGDVAENDPSWVAATTLWALIQAGMRHIEIEQPVFRLSRFVSRLYTTQINPERIGKLLTTESMKEDSGAPNDFLIKIDDLVSQYTDPTRADGIAVQYAWKKKSPRLSGSGWNKRRVDQEYVFGLWPTAAYGIPI